MAEGDWSRKQRDHVSTSHLHMGSRKNEREVQKGYKLSESTPSDVLPLVRLHILTHL